MILQIFCALVSDRLPPITVKSWLKTNTVLPLISPRPVTCKRTIENEAYFPEEAQRQGVITSTGTVLITGRGVSPGAVDTTYVRQIKSV